MSLVANLSTKVEREEEVRMAMEYIAVKGKRLERFPFSCGFYWFDDQEGSTHVLKVDSVRLQKIGNWVLVWAQVKDEEELVCRIKNVCVWELQTLFEDAEIRVASIDFAIPEETEENEPLDPEDWDIPLNVHGKNTVYEDRLERAINLAYGETC